jgi:hypothetical protein
LKKGINYVKNWKWGILMKYSEILHLNNERFRRLTGIKKTTFEKMLEILTQAHKNKKAKGGRPNSVEIPEMLLMTLEYIRESRTYFHIGTNYGISESASYKTIKWVEDTLIKNGTFSLPGKKELLKNGNGIEIILIDATESQIERPKKDKRFGILGRKNYIL